jgi:ubiquinone/menaquinone biosynthesis C-methylase UbiE
MKNDNKNNVCPWWMGYLLLIPFRKIRHNPQKMVGPYLKPGMTAIDYGSAMGYFSIPMARMVGPKGKVFCFDVQPKMFSILSKRAKTACVSEIVETKLISGSETDFIGLDQLADFALLFAVAHEVPDREILFINLYRMLKPGAHLFFGEPPGHVKKEEFDQSVSLAEKAGFYLVSEKNRDKLVVVFKK